MNNTWLMPYNALKGAQIITILNDYGLVIS